MRVVFASVPTFRLVKISMHSAVESFDNDCCIYPASSIRSTNSMRTRVLLLYLYTNIFKLACEIDTVSGDQLSMY